MNILVIDASTQMELVAARGPRQVRDMTRKAEKSHSVTLFDSIDAALAGAGLSATDLQLIAVGVGPGSFTGIRIAVSTARMLAQVLSIPLAGLSSPLIYAASMESLPEEYLMTAFDAKKGRVFGALYRRTEDALKPDEIIVPGDYRVEELLAGINTAGQLRVAGHGIEKYHELIRSARPECEIYDYFTPLGETACALAERAYRDHPEQCADFRTVLPNYARKSDAEALKELRAGGLANPGGA